MKSIYTLAVLLLSCLGAMGQINLPITWDNQAVTYSFTDFGGNVSALAPSPTDSTNTTLRSTKTSGAQTWAGTTITPANGLASAIPFASGSTTISVKVHAPASGIVVRLKAEQANVPTISVETEATTSMAGWQTLVFNFANQATGTAPINFANTYNMLSIFYGFGTVGNGAIFYADSVFFGGASSGPPPASVNLPITWDAAGLTYSFTDFGGTVSALAPSPTNSTNTTLRTEKTVGAQTWAGTTITPTSGLGMPIPFATGATTISVHVYTPAAGTIVRLKAEQAGVPTISVETEDTTTAAGWQTLEFNFANQAAGTAPINFANTYNMLSIFYAFGTAGNGGIFYADSVFFGGSGPVGPPPVLVNLPITWDNSAVTYSFTDFGGTISALAPSPTNSTNTTLRTEKPVGAQTWAGTTITPTSGLGMPIPFATGATTISVHVYTPAAGTIVRLKAEQAGAPAISVETEDTTTAAGWQTLEFNFANQAAGTAPINFANTYNMLSIFYAFGTAGSGAVYYADSVFFGGSGPVGPPPVLVNLPITWDNSAVTYSFTDFGGTISALAPSPTNSTNTTLRSEKPVGAQTWAGTTITPTSGLGVPIPFAAGATTISVHVYTPAAGTIVRLKAEQAGAPAISVETEDTTTAAGWQTLEFNFANQATGTAPINFANTYNMLSIFYAFGTAGNGGIFYADSVFFGGSGPVGPPPVLVNLPITWDNSAVTYSFTDFGGTISALAPSPTNSTNTTLRSEKPVGAQTWAGTTITPTSGLGVPIPFAAGATTISVHVYTPAAGTIVRLKAEQAGAPAISVETEDTTTAAGWQTLEFNFANQAAGTAPINFANTYNMLSIFYAFGTAGSGAVYYADSVFFGGSGPVGPPPVVINLPITWDDPTITYSYADFGGNVSALAPSPTDSTNITLRSEKTTGAQTWAGTTITPTTGLTAPIPFALGATILSVKVYTPAAGTIVRLKAEQAGVPTISVETEATTTMAGWQTLEFNFANAAAGTAPLNLANTYNVLSIFYNFGTAGTGAVYYADSVFFGGSIVGPPATPINLPITWDDATLNYVFTDFGGNASALAPSPTDSTNITLRTEKTVGAQIWAGTTITPPVGLATAIPFASGATTMTVKVHVPASGVVVRLKAEQAGVPTVSVETEATSTTSGWQTLVFNFANQATGTAPINFANTYNMLSIFYAFGSAGTGAIYYTDSVVFGGGVVGPPPTPISLPITWDNPALNYVFTDFGGNVSALAPSPTDTTNTTLRSEKTVGAQTWAGTTLSPPNGLATAIPFATGATTMSVKVHAPAAGVVVRLKAEQAGVPTISVETEATTTTAGWQTLVFDFANQAGGTAPINFANTYNVLSIFYAFGTAGNGGIYYADSVFFGGTPTGPPPTPVNLPITWDNTALNYVFTDFGGNASALAPSPTDPNNTTLRTEKTAGAQTWAGTTITPANGLATAIPFATGATTMSVKVHAPAAGIVVRLKAEQAGVPTISVETEATTTATGWQTLVFDFANQATGTAPINFANTYNLLSIFYAFGSNGTGAIFHADSVYFGGTVVTPPQLVSVTFQVDMSRETISANGIHIAGSFQGWSPNATPMVSQGNGLYTYTAQLPANSTYEYKFINGNQWGPGFDESVPASCAQNNNRFVVVGTSNVTVPVVCFGRCVACGVSVFEPGALNAAIKVYPNPAQGVATIAYTFETPGDLEVTVYDGRGRLVTSLQEKGQSAGELQLLVQDWAEGLYHIRISNGHEQIARQLVVRK